MNNIEVEVRSFVSKGDYKRLLEYFHANGSFVSEDYQETFYFLGEEDLRIQRNKFYSKIWLKKGKIHDDAREEIEVKFDKDRFEELEKLFLTLGYDVEIKWFRKRHKFKWDSIDVMVDYTKGYGYIIELEKMSCGDDKDSVLVELKSKLDGLGVPLSPKEEFSSKYEHYKKNWKELVSS